jgi:hypothetical protein
MLITLKNDFHDSETIIRRPASGKLSDRQVKRSKKILCGVSGCTCSGPGGERGTQDHSAAVEGQSGEFTLWLSPQDTSLIRYRIEERLTRASLGFVNGTSRSEAYGRAVNDILAPKTRHGIRVIETGATPAPDASTDVSWL